MAVRGVGLKNHRVLRFAGSRAPFLATVLDYKCVWSLWPAECEMTIIGIACLVSGAEARSGRPSSLLSLVLVKLSACSLT